MKHLFTHLFAVLFLLGTASTVSATTLIEYSASTTLPAGITISGTTVMESAKIHTNKDAVNVIQLKNGFSSSSAYNGNAIVLHTEGGFQEGDTLTIAGFTNNSDATKTATVAVVDYWSYGNSHVFSYYTFSNFIDGRVTANDPVEESFVLEEAMDSIVLGRTGNTNANVCYIKVSRPEVSEEDNYVKLSEITNYNANDIITVGAFDVVYANGARIYIQDETGSSLVYLGNYGLQAGDHVASGMQAKVAIYQNLHEIVPITPYEDLTITEAAPIHPVVATEVPSLANQSLYCVYEGVSVNTACSFISSSRTTLSLNWNNTTVSFYNQFGVTADFVPGKTYNVLAVNTVFGSTLQAYPIAVEKVQEPISDPFPYSITFSETAVAGTLDGATFGSNGFVLTVHDFANKFAVDVAAQKNFVGADEYIGQYSYRLKPGQASTEDDYLSLQIPVDGILRIATRSANSADTTRTMYLTQNGSLVGEYTPMDRDTLEDGCFQYYYAKVKAGTVDITYPIGGDNFYNFALLPFEEPGNYYLYIYELGGYYSLINLDDMPIAGIGWTMTEENLQEYHIFVVEQYGDYVVRTYSPDEDSHRYLTRENAIETFIYEGYYYSIFVPDVVGEYYLFWNYETQAFFVEYPEIEQGPGTNLENTEENSANKILKDQKIIILRGDKQYDILGRTIR